MSSIDSSSGKDDDLIYFFFVTGQWFESHAILFFYFYPNLLFIIKMHTSLFAFGTRFIYLFKSFVNSCCKILKVGKEAVLTL